jgi:hypothetical protein
VLKSERDRSYREGRTPVRGALSWKSTKPEPDRESDRSTSSLQLTTCGFQACRALLRDVMITRLRRQADPPVGLAHVLMAQLILKRMPIVLNE